MGPAIAAALITGGAGIAQGGIQAASAGRMNKRGERFATNMYDKQRADSLADWNMVNQYNSPEAQMRRFKDAGLNPNLIYGQSNEAPAVRSSSMSQPHYVPQNIDVSSIGDAVSQYYNVKRAESDIAVNNAKEKVYIADAVNKAEMNSTNYWLFKSAGERAKAGLTDEKIKYQQGLNHIQDATYDDVVKWKHQLVANAAAEEKLKSSQIAQNLANALKTRYETTDILPGKKRQIAATINLLQNNATQAEIDAGIQAFGLKFGTYGSSKGILYHEKEMKNIDSIMSNIDSDWQKYHNNHKTRILSQLNK